MHERALRGTQIDPAIGAESLERLAHRLPGDPEPAGELTLDQVLAGAQGSGGDQFEEGVVDALAQRPRAAPAWARSPAAVLRTTSLPPLAPRV
ncbi:hypothetical protein GCM10010331_36860 [Streptomyces xanthochromogenes]|nr:hypothetical protein GCM10010331_36860 [Streptomyces xanthochromogenes]